MSPTASKTLCQKALDLNEERLSAFPHVVGLGIDERGPGDNAVAVYVDQKLPASQLPPDQRVPTRLYVTSGGARRAVPVRVIEQGPVTLEGPGFEP
jgi:hypothetical protein